jgi:hypothetical protein
VPWDVLQEDVAGSYVANDSVDFGPQVSLVVFSGSPSSDAEGLAGVPAGKQVKRSELMALELLYVTNAGHVRPVLF